MAKKRLRKKDIKEDQLVTFTLRASSFVREHFAKVVSGALILVAAVGILLFTANARRGSANESEQAFAIGMDQFLLGNAQDASATFLNVADRYSNHQVGRTSMYFLGECYKSLYRYEEAIDAYDRYLQNAGDTGEFTAAAKIAKSLCNEGLGRFTEAAEILEGVANTMDSEDVRYADVLFRIGVFYQEAGNSPKAVDFFRRVKDMASGPLKKRASVRVSLLE